MISSLVYFISIHLCQSVSDINVKARFCGYNLCTNFFILAVLKQWLLQLKGTDFSFVFIIYAEIIRKCRSLF